jgi:hypothetical protein
LSADNEHWLFWVLLVGSAVWVLTREKRKAAWMVAVHGRQAIPFGKADDLSSVGKEERVGQNHQRIGVLFCDRHEVAITLRGISRSEVCQLQ